MQAVRRGREPVLTKPLHDHPDWTVIDLDAEPLPTQERMNAALLKAVTLNYLQPGAHIVALYNGIATLEDAPEPVDSVSVIHLGEHLERMTSSDLRVLGKVVPLDVLRAVVDLATEIGREGREGQPIGTILVVGDTRKVLSLARFQNFNPFRGYTRAERDIRHRDVREQIKEIAKLDGAILIGRDGIAEAACLHLSTRSDGVTLAEGVRQPAHGRGRGEQADERDRVRGQPVERVGAGVPEGRGGAAHRAARPPARLAAVQARDARPGRGRRRGGVALT